MHVFSQIILFFLLKAHSISFYRMEQSPPILPDEGGIEEKDQKNAGTFFVRNAKGNFYAMVGIENLPASTILEESEEEIGRVARLLCYNCHQMLQFEAAAPFVQCGNCNRMNAVRTDAIEGGQVMIVICGRCNSRNIAPLGSSYVECWLCHIVCEVNYPDMSSRIRRRWRMIQLRNWRRHPVATVSPEPLADTRSRAATQEGNLEINSHTPPEGDTFADPPLVVEHSANTAPTDSVDPAALPDNLGNEMAMPYSTVTNISARTERESDSAVHATQTAATNEAAPRQRRNGGRYVWYIFRRRASPPSVAHSVSVSSTHSEHSRESSPVMCGMGTWLGRGVSRPNRQRHISRAFPLFSSTEMITSSALPLERDVLASDSPPPRLQRNEISHGLAVPFSFSLHRDDTVVHSNSSTTFFPLVTTTC
ncbi:zinc finger domain, LSD1 subclass domain-containing protein [Cardiosporidium cionae]|uniref:Zinc finger domain, LSD1 subclass domain-containing protein n=1 Tax=Cardiosporidium cionae TaxID=476202 RepID=A0ABQ7JD89_9APIC|nr:zinc finger domain, LSD1 subclass domain-containing protein [Cardiosporidium cionae]|eukprot:KAF8821960.1 zinc finger domain, LSD1 subclass domain-containing protein [Cardiosporidium cionae]